MVRGVLVAGGQGRRLGLGVPKALVKLGGRPLYERAVGRLTAVADEIVIAAPASVDIPAGDSWRRVFDRPPGGGPLAGVVAALDDHAYEQAFVLGVDFPFLSMLVIDSMLSR